MIAYSHNIKFIPELKNHKESNKLFFDEIVVRESLHEKLTKKLNHKMTFPDSQGRRLTLFSDNLLSANKEVQTWAFEVGDVATFHWHSNTKLLEYIKHDDVTEALLEYWVLHVVLPTFLIIEDMYEFLHAGAVEVDGEPVLFIAPSMGGKSTMTDFFMKQGHKMISDDKVATFQKNGNFYAVPSYAYHRPYRNKEDIGMPVNNFADISKKMHVIYALEGVDDHNAVSIKQLFGVEKFMSLRNAKEMNLFFS